jgi:hypothetical protein
MLTEIARCRLPKALKARFEAEFKAAAGRPPDPAAATALAEAVLAIERSGVPYTGRAGHTKKALALVGRAPAEQLTESQLEKVGSVLTEIGGVRVARRFLEVGQRRFPASPQFPYLRAMTFILGDPWDLPVYIVQPLLEDAERLASALPPGDRRDLLLKDVQERLRALEALDPLGSFRFGFPFGRADDDYEDDYDD